MITKTTRNFIKKILMKYLFKENDRNIYII